VKKNILLILILLCSFSIVKGQKVAIPSPDSANLVKGLVKSVCDNLKEGIKKGEISEQHFAEKCMLHLLTGENFTAIKNLSGDYSVDSDVPKPEHIDKGFRVALRACIAECPLVDTFFGYDGRQRPAYSHFSNAICGCISTKKAQFADPELAYLKYGYIRDSCSKLVFLDPENLKIAYAANDFQTKAEVDAFDKNFSGYYVKNCTEALEFVIHTYKVLVGNIETVKKDVPEFNEFYQERDNAIKHLLHQLTPTLGISTKKKTSDFFTSSRAYQVALPMINSAKMKFKNLPAVDYIPNVSSRSDGIIEYRYTMYHTVRKTKKHSVICQLVFEFEEKSETIAAFRYIDQSQIANLEALLEVINGN
jgi:hypothetical protein